MHGGAPGQKFLGCQKNVRLGHFLDLRLIHPYDMDDANELTLKSPRSLGKIWKFERLTWIVTQPGELAHCQSPEKYEKTMAVPKYEREISVH